MAVSATYQPRAPEQQVLVQVVRDHFETFRAEAATIRDGEGLPRFVEEEFRAFLRCGCLAAGFARLRCETCGRERLLPFSCKGRGFCPSCGGRRMSERAAHLVDRVLPAVPIRQWVLTMPVRLRYVLAWDHDLCRAVIGVAMRTIVGHLRHLAREAGVVNPRGGGIVIVQRFGGALNLNVHIHALVLDGVFARAGETLRFHPTPDLTAADVGDVLATIVPRVRTLLARRGLGDGDADGGREDTWADEAPVLAGLAAAAVQGRVALGSRAGARVRRSGDDSDPDDVWDVGPCHARQDGFDLQAAVRVPGGQRDRLERLCRYAVRPPIGQERLRLTPEGRVVLVLRRAWADGTTHLVFEPLELLERLAVLVPRPRVNLLFYHGVLGARAAWRAQVVAFGRRDERVDDGVVGAPVKHSGPCTAGGMRWAELMRRAFGFDVLECGACGGRLRLVALIEQPAVIARILRHLHLPTEVPGTRAARSPPHEAMVGDTSI